MAYFAAPENSANTSDLPTDRVESIRGQLLAEWKIDADVLNKSRFQNRGAFETAKAKLNAKYKHKEHKLFTEIRAEQQKQQRVQEFVGQPTPARTPAEEAQLRMELDPEQERLVFPEQVDPRIELRNVLDEERRLQEMLYPYVEHGGKLYHAKTRDLKTGGKEYTEKANLKSEVPREEVEMWLRATNSLKSLQQRKLQTLALTGGAGPSRIESLMSDEVTDSVFRKAKRLSRRYFGLTTPGVFYRGIREATGFGKVVREDIDESQTAAKRLVPARQEELHMVDEGPVKFISPDGKKTGTVSGDQVAAFEKQFPEYKRVK